MYSSLKHNQHCINIFCLYTLLGLFVTGIIYFKQHHSQYIKIKRKDRRKVEEREEMKERKKGKNKGWREILKWHNLYILVSIYKY